MQDVLIFRQAAYAPSTQASYRTHRKCYLSFCQMLNLPLVPASTNILCLYSAYLARFLVPQSVCLYLNFVGLLHREYGFPNPLLDNFVLKSVLNGMRRLKGSPPKPMLPITPHILLLIRRQLNLSNSFHASFWAICLTAFFGLFRKSHLLPVSKFDPLQQFTRADFISTNTGFIVNVRWSKTIQFGQRTIYVPLVRCPQSLLCPVFAISNAFRLTPAISVNDQAFCWRFSSTNPNKMFSYRSFMTFMKQCLVQSGYSAEQYGTHSLRRGGASFALEAGVSLDTIAIMGDWKSDAMFLNLQQVLTGCSTGFSIMSPFYLIL